MVNIFCGALLGCLLGTFLGCVFIAGAIKRKIDKISKKAMHDVILGYTIIEYED